MIKAVKGSEKTTPEFKVDDVPEEVREVWIIQRACEMNPKNICIKTETWKRLQRVINNYPEWFPENIPGETTNDPIYDDEDPNYIRNNEDGL